MFSGWTDGSGAGSGSVVDTILGLTARDSDEALLGRLRLTDDWETSLDIGMSG